MPVFLLPIIAGGWYYYKNVQENAQSEQQPPQELPSQQEPQDSPASDEIGACSSIEVSLQEGSSESTTIIEEPTTVTAVKSQVLHRKGSTDTAQTEVSEDGDDERIEQEQHDDHPTGILGAACGGCDEGALLEIVECGNKLEKRIAVVFS